LSLLGGLHVMCKFTVIQHNIQVLVLLSIKCLEKNW